MKPFVANLTPDNTCLKFFPYQARTVRIDGSIGVERDDGKIVVRAGTPYPANDATCIGYILYDVVVESNDDDVLAPCVFEGTIDQAKLDAADITVNNNAKQATPRVTFFTNVS